MTGNELRSQFLKFFEDRGHKIVRSSSLVPAGDATLLFSNAGMNQFKDVFLGKEKRDYLRATSSQKCVRAGGKHNDLENVGRTARHHTFFEMLGNFSFGDYFKEEAITFCWDFLIKTAALDPKRMAATVFKGEGDIPMDKEAFGFWKKYLPEERIFALGMHDNFWAMGDTGPCGPCSELHYHQGEHIHCQEEAEGRICQGVACECDRWIEVWNLVFMQYNRDDKGTMAPLPAPCVDTGMGLERLAAVVQGKYSNYDTDLIQPLIVSAAAIVGKTYGDSEKDDVSLRVIADHIRASVFLISDGVIPSNEGRGYVLRKIVRRAARHGKMLGHERPFLHDLVGEVTGLMGAAYPEISENYNTVRKVLLREEEVFASTISLGMAKLLEASAKLTPPDEKSIPGDILFKLYDTFGFPLDLAEDIASDLGLKLDMGGFNEAMERQRTLARQSWKGEMDTQSYHEYSGKGISSTFDGYGKLSADGAKCLLILKDGARVDVIHAGDHAEIVFDRTPFYSESGGQVGDTGHISTEHGVFRVDDTQKPVDWLIFHSGEVISGEMREGDLDTLEVDVPGRSSTRAHHTATHLLHAALRQVLGTHVKQAGSLVSPTHLRFDFHHFSPIEPDVLASVEELVNEEILKNSPVVTQVMDIDHAVASGAMALFGEKYGEKVRVVSVPGFSKELCGGTHVDSTGQIGLFKIMQERSVSAGVRRIEAVAHMPAYRLVKKQEELLHAASLSLNIQPERLPEMAQKLQDDVRRLEKELSKVKLQAASGAAAQDEIQEVGGFNLLVKKVEGLSPSEVKNLADSMRDRVKSGVVVIGNKMDEKVSILVALTKDAAEKFKAVDLAKPLGKVIGGGGGGKPDLAEAGGKLTEKLDEALSKAGDSLKELLGKLKD